MLRVITLLVYTPVATVTDVLTIYILTAFSLKVCVGKRYLNAAIL